MHAPSVPFSTVNVGGVPFRVLTPQRACDWLLERARSTDGPGINIRLANAYNVALANSDADYRDLLIEKGINFPDGMPVVWYMRLQRQGAHRVRGPSLFTMALKQSVATGSRHFFLGGTPEALTRLEEKVLARFPGIAIAGSYSPPFTPLDDKYVADCAERIRQSDADIVWLGLGTPKQDYLGTALAADYDMVTVNVGAAFDFLSGTVQEAPLWVQSSGFEWLYRLLTEPQRLWRRYLVGNIRFLAAVNMHLIRESRKGKVES